VRAADEHHQVIGIALSGLPEIQQVPGAQRARVAAKRLAVETDQGFRVGEFGVLRRGAGADPEQPQRARLGAGRGTHIGELRREGQARAADPLRRVRAQRFANGVAHQRRAIDHVRGAALELGIGEQDEPCPERRAVGLVRKADLRGGAGAHHRDEGHGRRGG
jgi:hypothetical protein